MKIDKQMVIELSKKTNEDAFKTAYQNAIEVIDSCLNSIKIRVPYIKSYDLLIANEVLSETETVNSSIDIFAIFDAYQIELNNTKKSRISFKEKILNFFKNFKVSFRRNKNKKTQAKEVSKIDKSLSDNILSYNVKSLFLDIRNQLTKTIEVTSGTYLCKNKIILIGTEQFGPMINIYPVFKCNEGYKLYNISNNKELIINMNNRFENYDIKCIKTSYAFENQIRLFNNMFYNVFNYNPNQIFMESLLYNCPNELFKNEGYETFINLLNYLKNNIMNNFVSIRDENTKLFLDKLNTVNYQTAIKFINSLEL